jgi:hypothetical protein
MFPELMDRPSEIAAARRDGNQPRCPTKWTSSQSAGKQIVRSIAPNAGIVIHSRGSLPYVRRIDVERL